MFIGAVHGIPIQQLSIDCAKELLVSLSNSSRVHPVVN